MNCKMAPVGMYDILTVIHTHTHTHAHIAYTQNQQELLL